MTKVTAASWVPPVLTTICCCWELMLLFSSICYSDVLYSTVPQVLAYTASRKS